MIDISLIKEWYPYLLEGALVTIQIATIGCLLGFALGTLIGLVQSNRNRFLNPILSLYVNLIRGTPMLIQIAVVYYGVLQLGLALPAFWAASLAIGLNSSAYVSQVIRSGVASVSSGQIEAAQTLGLSPLQTTRYIVLPQAVRVVLPALGNEFITLVKDSSLASTIGVMELSKQGSFIRSRTYDALTVYFAVAVLYLLMTTTLSILISRLEQRMNRHVKN